MSAKWRRSKKHANRFDLLGVFGKLRNKDMRQSARVKNSKKKKRGTRVPNRFPKAYAERKMREPEPLVDVLEEKEEIIVVSEFAGFEKENLRVHVKDQRLTLSAEGSNRRFYKSLNLPKRVIPDAIRTTCKNGVLEIQLKKAAEERTIDKVAD